MTPERWERVKELFAAAQGCDPRDRETYVAQGCGGDSEVCREVLELLAVAAALANTEFIDEPIIRLLEEPESSLERGYRLGLFRIEREIGRGGMGAVYLAIRDDQGFAIEGAVKVLRRDLHGGDLAPRFQRERQILYRLVHPNIARMLELDTAPEGFPYFIMEYVEGVRIDQYCSDHGLEQKARLQMFATVCRAVQFAHQNLVVHCDLKPENILVDAKGVPKLLDFGIAKLLQAPESTAGDRMRRLTRDYASPEQLRGEVLTTATDVYSLGVLLHLLLVGGLPARRHEDAAGGGAAAAAPAPQAVQGGLQAGGVVGGLRGDLAKIVAKSLALAQTQRYASAEAFADDIDRFLRGLPVAAHKDSWGYRTARFVRRNWLATASAALVLLMIFGFGITSRLLLRQSVRHEQRARRVSSFLEELFKNPDPGQSRGETIPAREILDHGAEQIQQELREEPETRAALMETMAKVYSNLGLYPRALALARNAVSLRRSTLGNNHPDLAESLHTLAGVLRQMDNPAAAEPLLREAVAIQRRNAHGDDAELARGLNNLAMFVGQKGDLDQAEALHRESLAMKLRLFHGDNVEVATGLHNLANVYQEKHDLAAAEGLYLKALAMRRRLAGPRPDPDVATTLNNLAALREDQHNRAAAESLYREACDIRERLYNSGPEVPRCLNNLARMVEARGAAGEAESLYRRAVDIYERNQLETRTKDHAIFLRNLANLLCRPRAAAGEPRLAEGEALARQSLAIFQRLPAAGWRTADAESVLGGCLAGAKRMAEAEPLLLTSAQRLCDKPGAGSPYTGQALARLDIFYASQPAPKHGAAACPPPHAAKATPATPARMAAPAARPAAR